MGKKIFLKPISLSMSFTALFLIKLQSKINFNSGEEIQASLRLHLFYTEIYLYFISGQISLTTYVI